MSTSNGATPMMNALYFDGQSTRRHAVVLLLHKGVAVVTGDGIRRTTRLAQVQVSEPLLHAPRLLRLPDGSSLEVSDPQLSRLLRKNGHHDHWVVRWQQNWGLALAALCLLLTLLLLGYQWGLPWGADRLARHLPAALEQKIGDAQLSVVDDKLMEPSKLDPIDQARLQKLFNGLRPPNGEKAAYRLQFRHSKIGPNAFALPNGVIILTDQLVMLARDDQAVLGVLAHELGHLQRRHALRRMLQGLGVGVIVNLFVGDVSAVLTAVPTLLLDQKYSRDFEREADQYAIAMLRANAVPLAPMADLFVKLGNSAGRGDAQKDRTDTASVPPATPKKAQHSTDVTGDFFSSHPSDAERIAALRAADSQ